MQSFRCFFVAVIKSYIIKRYEAIKIFIYFFKSDFICSWLPQKGVLGYCGKSHCFLAA